MRFIQVGPDVYVDMDRCVTIMPPNYSIARRTVALADKENKFFLVTRNKKRKSVVILDTGHVFMSPFKPTTLLKRLGFGLSKENHKESEEDQEKTVSNE
jgi:regulator of extracellular matrix RemA (YlzA/DUF370 family)